MRLDDLDPSKNVNDQGRGGGGFRMGSGGGGGGMASLLIGILPMLLGRKMGCGTIAIIVAIGAFFLYSGGGLNLGGPGMVPGAGTQNGAGGNVACDTEAELFACRMLKSTEDTWGAIFRESGAQYRPAKLEFYQGGGQSGCGAAQSAMGPFYCPSDQGIYLDTSFFAQMSQQMNAGGDFAYAYVIAHEVGHHIQNLSGVAREVRQLQVRMELQADCYAGVWAARNKNRIEAGDIEEAMRAANAIGDDTLQRNAGRRVVPESFTHGTSEQRMAWLRRGLQSGDPKSCDTFSQR